MDGADIGEWSDKVEDLLVRCEARAAEPGGLVEELYGLVETGPARICRSIRPGISRPTLQTLLDAGASESAALRLLSRCTWMLSRGGEGLVIASVLIPQADCDYSFSAFSEAAALSGALATCLQERVIAERRRDPTNPRLSQS